MHSVIIDYLVKDGVKYSKTKKQYYQKQQAVWSFIEQVFSNSSSQTVEVWI